MSNKDSGDSKLSSLMNPTPSTNNDGNSHPPVDYIQPLTPSAHHVPQTTIPSFGSLSGSISGSLPGSMSGPVGGITSISNLFPAHTPESNNMILPLPQPTNGVHTPNYPTENYSNHLSVGSGSINGNNSIPAVSPSDKSIGDELFSGASNLASNLNNLLSGKFTSISDDLLNSFQDHFDHIIEPQLQPTPPPSTKINDEVFDDGPLISFINSFDNLENNQKNYLKLFYEKYSLWLMPLSPVSGPKNFFNKIIIQQAQKVPFLLNAIFSISASFEYEESKLSSDDYYKRTYIGLSLKGLNQVFSQKSKVSEYIEPLILTSLLFVTDAASTINGSWRAHLKGANDLFRQYLALYKKNSPSILLSTTWFASFEIIAVITNPVGGSINNELHLDDILSPILYKDDWNLAIQLGFVLPNGFNVFLGQSSYNVSLFIHFLKLSIKIRNSDRKSIDSDDFVMLMQLFDQALRFSLASPNGLIEPTSPYYPKTGGMNYLPHETFGYKNNLVFSWFDLSDKIHIRGLYLTVLTNPMYLNLPSESKLVQDVVSKILEMCYFFDGIDFNVPRNEFNFDRVIKENTILNDRRLLMLHSSILICGSCCINNVDRMKIELYFRSLISLGARTVENSFNRLCLHWSGDLSKLDFVPYL